ncbi:MAG: cytochrome P450 [Myxococcota bacterium]
MPETRNLFDPAVREDPYPFYAALRATAPACVVDPVGAWLVTSYDAVLEVLRQPELYSSTAMRAAMTRGRLDDDEGPPPMVISSDPPQHTRLRTLVNRGFTPRRIQRMEPLVRRITKDLFAEIDRRGECDLVGDLTVPLPVMVISEMLGIEPERFEDFKRWSQVIVSVFGRAPSEDQLEAFHSTLDELDDYLDPLIERRRSDPRDDIISVLTQKEEEDALSADEVIGFVILLLIAGNETTTNLIGNTIIALWDNPEQLALLNTSPERIPDAIEEALRFSSPVQMLFRQTTQDVELGGEKIPEGSIVMPCYAAANRDPKRFEDPDRFDIGRDNQGHVAFGLGLHFCLGASLARLEARIALEGLVPRLAKLRCREERIRWSESPFLRGPQRLLAAP